jgi:hypothetical protein
LPQSASVPTVGAAAAVNVLDATPSLLVVPLTVTEPVLRPLRENVTGAPLTGWLLPSTRVKVMEQLPPGATELQVEVMVAVLAGEG